MDIIWNKYLGQIFKKKVKGCPICHGMDLECACMRLYKSQIEVYKSGVPFEFRFAGLESIVNESDRLEIGKVVSRLHGFAETGYGVCISGRRGSGRTLALCVILNKAMADGYTAKYVSMKDISTMMGQGWHKAEMVVAATNALVECEFLAIDDVGADLGFNKANFNRTCFESILRKRNQSARSTFISLAPSMANQESPTEVSGLPTMNDLERICPDIYGLIVQKMVPIILSNYDCYKVQGQNVNKWWLDLEAGS